MTTVLIQNTPLINNQEVYDFLQTLHLLQIGSTFVKNDDKEIIKANETAQKLDDLRIFVDDEKYCLKRLGMIKLGEDEFTDLKYVAIPAAEYDHVFQSMRDHNLMLYFKPYKALENEIKKKRILSYRLMNQ